MDTDAGTAAPTVHGVYDYWLGGSDHLRADRELARAIGARFPFIPVHVRAAREFHLRAARWCAERGVTRLVAAGIASWKPGAPNVRDAAREAAPGVEAVYVLRGREAHARARALLPGGALRCALARAEFPAEVLSAPPVAAMTATGEPVGLALGLTLQFSPPAAAAGAVAAYAAALPAGSVIALSVSLVDRSPQAAELTAMFTAAPVYRYTAGDVEGWLESAGAEVVPPGACDVRLMLRCDQEAAAAPGAPGMTVGALGRVP